MATAKRRRQTKVPQEIDQESVILLFPDIVMLIVFQHLDTDSLVSASKVCKKWFSLSKDPSLWKKIDVRFKNMTLKSLWKLSRSRCGPSLKELHLRGNIGISKGMQDTVTTAFLEDLKQRSPNLTALSLEHFDLRNSAYNVSILPPQLTYLSLKHSMITLGWFDQLKGQFAMNNLHYLDLHECSKVSNSDLEALSYLKNMRTLNLSKCFRISARGIPMICANMAKLVTLDVSCCPGINDVALFYFGRHLKDLKNLYLPFCHLVTDGGIASLVKGAPELQCLNLFCCHEVTDQTLELISKHSPGLMSLDIRGCRVTDEAVDELKKTMPSCTVMYVPEQRSS